MHPNEPIAPDLATEQRRPAVRRLPVAATAMIAATALGALLSGCTAAAPNTAVAAPQTTPAVADAELPPEADAANLCGQASALEGIRYRSEWEHGQGAIDDAALASRVAALHDAWTYLVAGDTDVTPAVKYVQRVVAEGGLAASAGEYQTAMSKLAEACDSSGSMIVISALPGQGG